MTKLTIKEEMRAIDTKNRDWYGSLTSEERKKIGIWVLMRYLSSVKHNVKDFEEHYLTFANDIVNVHHNALRHHPQLQFQLMQAIGIGTVQYHPWVPPGKKGTESKLFKVMRTLRPEYNDDEIEIFILQHTVEELTEMFEELGYDKKEIKKILK